MGRSGRNALIMTSTEVLMRTIFMEIYITLEIPSQFALIACLVVVSRLQALTM